MHDAERSARAPEIRRSGRPAAALDVGRRRIGVAVTDPNGEMAMAHAVVERKGTRKDIEAIVRSLAGHHYELWVVGLPTATENADEMNRLARGFALRLAEQTSQEVVLVDEANSSAQAHAELRLRGLKQARRKLVVDKVAAKIILARWLAGAECVSVAPE